MPQFPWKPLRLLGNIDEQIDRAFYEMIDLPWGLGSSAAWQPDIDVFETQDAYLVEADVPGVPLGQIHVDVGEHWLTISGSRHSAALSQSALGARIERRTGHFSRRFYLEHAVDPSRVEREHEEGTLRLKITKCRPNDEPLQQSE